MPFRLAVVTPLFPMRSAPQHGMPIYNTVRELQKLAEVRVFCPVAAYPQTRWLRPSRHTHHDADPDFRPPGIDVEYLAYGAVPLLSRPFNARNCAAQLLPALRRFGADLILAYWLFPEGRGALLAGRKLGVPVVGGARGSDLLLPPGRLSRYLLGRTLHGLRGVLTVSEDLRRHALALGLDPARVRNVPNGCDTEVFHVASRPEARRRLGLPEDATLILFVGRLTPLKGLGDLIDAFVPLAEQRPRLLLACPGGGAWRPEWREKLRRHGLSNRVLLPGDCTPPQVAEWMAAADVFCLPSHSEGCPNVVIEALSCGRPVVATRVGGTPDLVHPGGGILVPPGQPDKLAGALAGALDRQWDEAAIAREFTRGWDEVARETLEFCLRCRDGSVCQNLLPAHPVRGPGSQKGSQR